MLEKGRFLLLDQKHKTIIVTTDDNSKFIFIFMSETLEHLEYTSVIIDQIMSSNESWWLGRFDVKIASKWKERYKKTGLSYETKCEILRGLGYEIKVERTEDLWAPIVKKRYHVKNSTKDFGIVEAPNADEAKKIIQLQEYPRKKTQIIDGEVWDLREMFLLKLKAEEIK